jgi:hypothetical protein
VRQSAQFQTVNNRLRSQTEVMSAGEQDKMYRASHLLVKHKNVRNPKSWKEPEVTRDEQEALAMIERFHASLVTGDPATLQKRFEELASTESHCSSAKRGGDLGEFGCVLHAQQRPFSRPDSAERTTAQHAYAACSSSHTSLRFAFTLQARPDDAGI